MTGENYFRQKMSQPDFDEFDYRERKRSPLDWRNPQSCASSDCKVIVNGGAKEYSIHMKIACRSSEFFFNIARGRSQPAEKLQRVVPTSPDGDVQLKTQDGMTTRIGRVADTVSELKGQVNKTLGISASRSPRNVWGPSNQCWTTCTASTATREPSTRCSIFRRSPR